MDKNKEYKLIKSFPNRNIGDIVYWNEETESWFWYSGGSLPADLTRNLEGLPNIKEWFEEINK